MPKTKRFKVWQRGDNSQVEKKLLRAFPNPKPKAEELGSASFWARCSASTLRSFRRELVEVRPDSLLIVDDGDKPEYKTLAQIAQDHWNTRDDGAGVKRRKDAWHFAFLDLLFNFQTFKKLQVATPELARRFAEDIIEEEYATEDHPPRVEQIEVELLRVWRERGWLTDVDTVTEQVAAINVELGHTPGYDGIEEDSAE